MPPALGPLAPTSDHTVTGVERSTGAGTYYSHVDNDPASGQPDADYLSIRVASVPFVPTDITGLVAWYDMSDTATITQAAGAVSQVNDKGPAGNNVTQGTAAAKPTTGASTINSLNVVTFDGGDRLSKATTPVLDAATLFAVARFDTFAANRIVVGSNTTAYWIGAVLTTGVLRLNRGTAVSGSTGMSTATAYILTGTFAAGGGASSANGWVNATQHITNANPGTGNSAGIQLGASNTLNPHLGAIGEVVIYDNVLGTTDRETVRDYLNTKWACY